MIHVFIVGSKGIPAHYGGFETFVENLTGRKQSEEITYYVSCMGKKPECYVFNGAECFTVGTPAPGAVGRILHVALVLEKVLHWVKTHPDEKTVVYILGCRIGPLLIPYAHRLHKRGVVIICNPDGLEWKRDKWNAVAKRFLRLCERCLVENSDLAICDSVNIERYIRSIYGCIPTRYIAYGADIAPSNCEERQYREWCEAHRVEKMGYYLVVGRFVPENNLEIILSEFMHSSVNQDLVIITNVEENSYYNLLKERTQFTRDTRVKFVGTVYQTELLKKIRENALAYLHGHEVGGTNPSLLEALGATQVNLLLDIGFNREVGQNCALYWTKEQGNLASLLERAALLSEDQRRKMEQMAKQRITVAYSWEKIVAEYESTFEDVYENFAHFTG